MDKYTYVLKNGIIIEDNRELSCGVSIKNQNSRYMYLVYSNHLGITLFVNGLHLFEEDFLPYTQELKEMQDAAKEANEFLGLVEHKNFNDAEKDAENLLRRCIIKYNGWAENDYTLSRPISDLKTELFNTQWFAPKEIVLLFADFALEQDSSSPYWRAIKIKLQSL